MKTTTNNNKGATQMTSFLNDCDRCDEVTQVTLFTNRPATSSTSTKENKMRTIPTITHEEAKEQLATFLRSIGQDKAADETMDGYGGTVQFGGDRWSGEATVHIRTSFRQEFKVEITWPGTTYTLATAMASMQHKRDAIDFAARVSAFLENMPAVESWEQRYAREDAARQERAVQLRQYLAGRIDGKSHSTPLNFRDVDNKGRLALIATLHNIRGNKRQEFREGEYIVAIPTTNGAGTIISNKTGGAYEVSAENIKWVETQKEVSA